MTNSKKVILNSNQLKLTIDRLSCEIIENHVKNFDDIPAKIAKASDLTILFA